MSKTTFFKRIALTAIAALGFGMLSVAPSQAVAGAPTLTTTTGSASVTEGAAQETATAATLTISGLLSVKQDSYTVVLFQKSAPATGALTAFQLVYLETVTYAQTRVFSAANSGDVTTNGAWMSTNASLKRANTRYDSTTVTGDYWIAPGSDNSGYVGAKFGLMLETGTSRDDGEGTYVYTASVTPYSNGTAGTPVTADLTFTVNKTAAAAAAASGTIDPSKSTAVLNEGTDTDATSDESVSVVATSANTTHGTIYVQTMTSASLEAPESITVTVTGPGLVGLEGGTTFGKSIKLAGDGSTAVAIRADGTAGTASIVVATTTVTFPAKTVTFYALAPSTVTASVNAPVIKVGTNIDVVRATFKDANGNIWGGDAYIYAADDAIAGDEDPVACTFDTTDQRHECGISGSTKGTTTFKVIDADEVADATVTSAAQSVRVSTGVASSVALSFDKATYAPGEKAQLRVSVLDGEGLAMPGIEITNALFTGGITSNVSFGSGSAASTELDDVTFTLSASTSAAANTNAGHKTYVVYMPATAGAVTVSALGGTGIAAAGRVAISATATVVDTSNDASIAAANAATDAASEAIDAANAATDAANLAAEAADAATVAAEEARDAADAATAAVEALATEVATLMAALKAQITTLANTVAKIAKKVKA